MSTRSYIGIENKDGSVEAIYAHWDGYLTSNGHTLLNHYKTEEKVRQLIALGSVSVLGEEIGEKHPFEKPYGNDKAVAEYEAKYGKMTLAYRRDRDEPWEHCEQLKFKNKEAFRKEADNDFTYLFTKEGKWLYVWYAKKGKWMPLTKKNTTVKETAKV